MSEKHVVGRYDGKCWRPSHSVQSTVDVDARLTTKMNGQSRTYEEKYDSMQSIFSQNFL